MSKRRQKKPSHPMGRCTVNTLHVGGGGRRFNAKLWATGIGKNAVLIKGRREGDGGSSPWSQAVKDFNQRPR